MMKFPIRSFNNCLSLALSCSRTLDLRGSLKDFTIYLLARRYLLATSIYTLSRFSEQFWITLQHKFEDKGELIFRHLIGLEAGEEAEQENLVNLRRSIRSHLSPPERRTCWQCFMRALSAELTSTRIQNMAWSWACWRNHSVSSYCRAAVPSWRA